MNVFRGKLPDITPLQVVAFVIGAVPQVLILFEIDLSRAQEGAVDKLLALAAVIFVSDAGLRGLRAVGFGRAQSLPGETGHGH